MSHLQLKFYKIQIQNIHKMLQKVVKCLNYKKKIQIFL